MLQYIKAPFLRGTVRSSNLINLSTRAVKEVAQARSSGFKPGTWIIKDGLPGPCLISKLAIARKTGALRFIFKNAAGHFSMLDEHGHCPWSLVQDVSIYTKSPDTH
jgi:hypothetical protein